MIKAEIVADSLNEFNNRITTMLVTMPRYILAEFNTHRMFSRNTASSRAIPFAKMVKSVEENPFIPIAFQKEHKGMQGTEYFIGEEHDNQIKNWQYRVMIRCEEAKLSHSTGLTKQLVNRSLEEFMWVTVLVTATEWENFFALRCPQYAVANGEVNEGKDEVEYFRSKKDAKNAYYECTPDYGTNKTSEENLLSWLSINKGQAEIHMMATAEAMWDAYNESTPKQLKAGEWHIPFEDKIDFTSKEYADIPENEEAKNWQDYAIKIATVMAARTSYTVVGEDQKPLSYKRMIEIHDELLAANPKHMSPFEHCAQAMEYDNWSGNFRGFIQYRKMISNENII